MNQNQVAQIKAQLSVKDGNVTTTSRDVAKFFAKKHHHVLRDIINLDCPPDFIESNFGFNEYKDSIGRKLRMYEMTRDGFTLLAMGFTGQKAMQFKIAYIEAFNSMEKALTGDVVRIKAELLRSNPMWRKIKRYKEIGLNNTEIGKLINRDKATVRLHLRRMESCGLIERPRNLRQMQLCIGHLKAGAI